MRSLYVTRLSLASAALALSCQGALGIEDLSDQPRPIGAGGSDEGAGGSVDPGEGMSGAGGAGGLVGVSGASGAPAEGGPEPVNAGNDLPDAAPPEPLPEPLPPEPLPPDAGTAEPQTIVVSGRVIDFFRRPVPNVPVSIGSQTVDTDADGRFSVPDVLPPYDASLMLSMIRFNTEARYGYVYQGLTRSDPTLQVYSALAQRSTDSLDLGVTNAEFEADDDRRVIVAFSSPDARFADMSIDSELISLLGAPEWTGPATTSGNVHALRLIGTDGFAGSPPIAYEAYQSTTLTVTDGDVAELELDMLPTDVPTANLSGSASGGTLSGRSHYVAVRFADGTALPVVDDSAGSEDFIYLVPALEDSSLVVAAASGSVAPYAVAWRDQLAPDQADITLAIPNPVNLSAPQAGATVTPATSYSWSPSGQTAQTYLWHLEFANTYEGMLVITSSTELDLPTFADGFTVPEGTPFIWSVETHGDAPNPDALTGPDGFLSPFSIGEHFPVGPGRGGGYYTESARRSVTMGSD